MFGEASKGAIGGAAAEAGSDYRAGVAAWVVAHGLRGRPLPGLDLSEPDAIPVGLVVESDHPVDDLEVRLSGGNVALIQAKLRCGVRELDDAVSQWAAAAGNLNEKDRLVVATSEFKGLSRKLAPALRRLRAELAGSPSSGEIDVLARIRERLADAGLASGKVELVLEAAIALQITEESEATARSMLDGAVVAWGEGEAAFQVLRADVLQLARHREGRTMDGWVELLRSNGLTLAQDENASQAARLVARKRVEERHRDRLNHRSKHLDLRGLGSHVPPIPVDPEGLQFHVGVGGPEADENSSGTRELGPALRRRGRALLTGLPGSGKSTALQHLAGQWAADDDGPLPVFIHSPDLLTRSPEQSPLDRVIELASAHADLRDHALLADAIRSAATTGRLALFADAVDEARHRRHDVVREIESLLRLVHADTELIVATRDVGHADSRRLELPELRLLPPRDGLSISGFVLESLAEREGMAGTWVDQRVSQVRRALDRDRHLAETPLALVSLAILSANSPDGELPTSRARLLSELLHVIAERWEIPQRRKGDVHVGVLSEPRDAVLALGQAFDVLANSLVETTSKSRITAILAEFFVSRWSMSPGPAEAAANEAIHFWDEAGVIAIAGDNVRARLAVLADIGTARFLARLDEVAVLNEMQERISEDSAHESLVLAGGLAPASASALVDASLGNLDTELLAARAIAEGAEPGQEAIMRLASALRSRLSSAPPAVAWRSAKAIARLPVPSDRQDEILRDFARSLPRSHVDLGQALAMLVWKLKSKDAESLMEVVIRSVPPPNLDSPPERDSQAEDLTLDRLLAFAGVDDAYSEVVEASAEYLLPNHPELAEVIREAGENCSATTAMRISRLLQDHGHEGIRSSFANPSFAQRMETTERSRREAWFGLLGAVAQLDVPADLTWRQRRRLDAIADFLATLRLGESSVGSLSAAWNRYPSDLKFVVETVAVLGGFPMPVLAAEARMVLDEEDQLDSELFVMDGGELADMISWDVVDQQGTVERLVRVFTGSHWLARVSASALLDAPHAEVVEKALISQMAKFPPRNRRLAARVAIFISSKPEAQCRTWQEHDDPHIRASAAWYVAHLMREGKAQSDSLLRSLRDPDASVVDDAIDGLVNDTSDDLADALELILSVAKDGFDLNGWTCPICGEWNPRVGESCSKCNQASPDPARRLRRLSEKANLRESE